MCVTRVKACGEVGLHSEVLELPTDIGEDMVLAHIRRLNHDPDIHGILVQLPLPPQLNRDKVLATVSVDKDVDGFHIHNLGALVTGNALFIVYIPEGASVADAKAKMDDQKSCQDLIVTKTGSKTEPMLGWMTNVDIGRLSKA